MSQQFLRHGKESRTTLVRVVSVRNVKVTWNFRNVIEAGQWAVA